MIPRGVEVFVGLDPIDLRWGFDRLVGVVHERMARRARSGALYVFFGRGRTSMKVFFADSNGLCILCRRRTSNSAQEARQGHLPIASVVR